MTVELLPCSKCRRVPAVGIVNQPPWGVTWRASCACAGSTNDCDRERLERRWNRFHGAPLTLAERPQDVPLCDDEPSEGDGVTLLHDRVPETWVGKSRAAKAVRVTAELGQPREVEAAAQLVAKMRKAPVATCDGKRWRDCGDPLARWSVMSCS